MIGISLVELGDWSKEIIRAKNIVLSVGHNSRRRPEIRYMKKFLEDDVIGNPVMIEGNISLTRGLRLKEGEWRWDPEQFSSGPLIQLGVHHADTFQYLLGPIKEVSGYQNHLYTSANIIDNAVTVLEFESGCLGYIGSSYITPSSYKIVLSGTKGRIFYDDLLGLFIFDNKGNNKKIEIETKAKRVGDSILEELDEFADCIIYGRKPEVSIEEGLRALAVIEAAVQANKNGSTVCIRDVITKAQRHN